MNSEFLREYIENFNISTITRQAHIAHTKLKTLKNKRNKDDFAIILYASYLQIIENFIIFLLVNLHEVGIENLFASNWVIRENYTELFSIQDYKISYQGKLFIENILKQILPKNVDDKIVHNYRRFIVESLEDYMRDKDFLNSYKHWLRVSSSWWITISMSLEWWSGKWFLIGDYDTSISYYTKKDDIIYKNDMSFNYEYIVAKIIFLENLLGNYKKSLLSEWKNIIIDYIAIIDDSILLKYGISRFKTPAFAKV